MRTLAIPNEALYAPGGHAFNCSIVEFQRRVYLFYRYTFGTSGATKIARCELNENLMPIPGTVRCLDIPKINARVETIDDPRVLEIGGRLGMVHVQGHYCGRSRFATSVCVSMLDPDGAPHRSFLPRYGKNVNLGVSDQTRLVASEKNWTPFVHDGWLYLAYTLNPLEVLRYETQTDTVTLAGKSQFDQSFWKHGRFLAGGTPLLPRGDEYVGFFHSWTQLLPTRVTPRTYHVGYIAISKDPPHRVTRMSERTLLSAQPDRALDLRRRKLYRRPNVVFPGGWIERNGEVILSAGWQECRCRLYVFSWDEILANTREIAASS